MAGESGGRSENRCMAPCLLEPITYATSLKPFVLLPKKPTQAVRALR